MSNANYVKISTYNLSNRKRIVRDLIEFAYKYVTRRLPEYLQKVEEGTTFRMEYDGKTCSLHSEKGKIIGSLKVCDARFFMDFHNIKPSVYVRLNR